MKIFVKGKGEVNLNDNDFLAEGGQGKVYTKGGIAYKIYSDPSKMIPTGKFDELSVLNSTKIIAPKDIILNSKNKPIGYTMRHLNNTHALVSMFTKGFCNRHSVTEKIKIELIQDMRGSYKFVHSKNIIVVDGNEFNFLVDNNFKEVYFLDVDSYQTKTYPAVALMESIRDRHNPNTFNQNTDWFAWAIVTFQLLIGIHPYRGVHKQYKTVDERMTANISVLNTDVAIPPVCQPFSVIPKALLEYYKAVFDQGKRLPPPDDFFQGGTVVIVTDVRRITGTDKFEIHLVQKFDHEIWEHISVLGSKITATVENQTKGWKYQCIGLSPKMGNPLYGGIDSKGMIQIIDASGKHLDISLEADALMSYNGNFYFKKDSTAYILNIIEKQKTIVSTKIAANLHANASKFFDGIIVQNLLGVAHITIFPDSEKSYTIPIKELKGKIIDAKFDSGVAMVVFVDNAGKYNRMVLRFSEDFNSYDINIVADITYTGLNFIVLENKICSHLNEKNELELFLTKKDNTLMKIISDPVLSSDMRLFKDGNTVLFARDKELYSLKMK